MTGTAHTLPYHELSDKRFEELCLWLVKREGYERAEHLGASGSEQGRDIVAWREGVERAFQCKRVRRFGPKDALAEAEKILALPEDQRPAVLVFIAACNISERTRQETRAYCAGKVACQFWGVTELQERVKRHPDIVEEFFQLGAARSEGIPPPLHQLPADLADFTGREEEVRELVAVLGGERAGAAISAIGGMGGIGKTALAVHVAHELIERYPDAQIVVELGGARGQRLAPAEAMGQVIRAFEPEARMPDEERQAVALYRSTLAGRRALILFDDAADGAQVRPLLPPPSCGVIVTSRRSIALPGMTLFNLDVLSEEEARELLRAIAGEGRATGAELDEIARLCGRLPLALRAAGSFVTIHTDWSPAEYVQTLVGERDRLVRLAHEDLDVRAVLGLSAAQLARERADLAAAWQMLSVFPAPFNRAAAAAVWAVDESEAHGRLSELTARSLLLYDAEVALYRLHDLMRTVARDAFAYGPIQPNADTERRRLDQAVARHAVHYLALGVHANDLYEQGSQHILVGLRQFDTVWPHLQAAFAQLRDHDDEAAARWLSDFAARMAYLLLLRATPRYRIPILEAALSAACRLGDHQAEGIHLGNLGHAYFALGEARRAIGYYQQALEISRQIGDHRNEGNWLGSLGLACADLGQVQRAIEYYEQALEIARQIDDRRGEGARLDNLGAAYFALGDPRRAIGHYEQALNIARQIGDRRAEGSILGNLGAAYFALGDPRRAIEHYEQALSSARQIGDRRAEGSILGNLGNAYRTLGGARKASKYLEQALEIAREIGDRRGKGNRLSNLGLLARDQGDSARARELWEEALRTYEAIEDPNIDLVRGWLAELGERAEPQAPD